MGYKLKKTIVFVGMMGAGKTAVGGAVAKILGVEFRDSDTEIEIAAAMSIAEIFNRDGEKFFRMRETEVLNRLLDGRPCILSTGGGAFLSGQNRRIIAGKGVALWLRADIKLLWSRVRHKNTRPLLRTDNPFETLRQLQEIRDPAYALAQLSVTARTEFSIEEMAGEVIKELARHSDILERL